MGDRHFNTNSTTERQGLVRQPPRMSGHTQSLMFVLVVAAILCGALVIVSQQALDRINPDSIQWKGQIPSDISTLVSQFIDDKVVVSDGEGGKVAEIDPQNTSNDKPRPWAKRIKPNNDLEASKPNLESSEEEKEQSPPTRLKRKPPQPQQPPRKEPEPKQQPKPETVKPQPQQPKPQPQQPKPQPQQPKPQPQQLREDEIIPARTGGKEYKTGDEYEKRAKFFDRIQVKKYERTPYETSQSNMNGPFKPEPYVVSEHSKQPISETSKTRQDAVRAAMSHAWEGYVKYAWGQDELKPVSKRVQNDFNMGLTIIDSLDTLWIMGLDDEFQKGRDWVAQHLNLNGVKREVSVFETFIRVVGGLLTAHDLSGDPIFLENAKKVVDGLSPAFRTKRGIPFGRISFGGPQGHNQNWSGGGTILAEGGTVQLELRALSRFLGDNKYAEMGDKSFFAIDDTPGKVFGALYPMYVMNDRPQFGHSHVGVGGMADSFYEYMVKCSLQTYDSQPRFKQMYMESANAVLKYLTLTASDGHMYTANLQDPSSPRFQHDQEHLACFSGGMFALGATYLDMTESEKELHMEAAKGITKTCYDGYQKMPTKMGPEAFSLSKGSLDKPNSGGLFSLLRPETVESIFVLYRTTGDSKYQDMGWEIFQAIEEQSKIQSGGYSGLDNVLRKGSYNDKMESFFLAETLKYLYLLFSPTDLISLDEFVFNTEAHPLRKFHIN